MDHQVFESENNYKYKSYIQRRRVGQIEPPGFDAEIPEKKSDESPITELDDENLFKDFNISKSFNSKKTDNNEEDLLPLYDINDEKDNNKYDYEPKVFEIPSPSKSAYRKDSVSYKPSFLRKNNGIDSAPDEDNKVAKLSIKVIKQALACFAILGLIVFLQQKHDASPILDFLRTNIVDNHTDLEGLTAGVRDIITECTKLFNGAP